MANAVEDALNRASAEQKEKNQQVIDEARRNISMASVQGMDDISPSSASSIERNAQIIAEAKRNIPFETMQNVDSIGPPMATPSNVPANSNVIDINSHTRSSIENIEQGPGNNYLQDNAMERFRARSQETHIQDPEHEQQLAR